jgi:hypothetical protein
MHQKMPAVNAGTKSPRYRRQGVLLKQNKKDAITNAIAVREERSPSPCKKRHPVHILVVKWRMLKCEVLFAESLFSAT